MRFSGRLLSRKWQRISDFFEWRVHFCLRREAGKWQDDNSTSEPDNDGFDSF